MAYNVAIIDLMHQTKSSIFLKKKEQISNNLKKCLLLLGSTKFTEDFQQVGKAIRKRLKTSIKHFRYHGNKHTRRENYIEKPKRMLSRSMRLFTQRKYS